MKTSNNIQGLSVLLMASTVMLGQSTLPPALAKTVQSTGQIAMPLVGRSACDASTTLYLRSYVNRATEIDRIGVDGSVLAPLIFDAPSARVQDFAISGSTVNVLISDFDGVNAQIQQFATKDGKSQGVVLLQKPSGFTRFLPEKLVAFNSGDFLVLGDRSVSTDARALPFAGIFNSSGGYVGPLTVQAGPDAPIQPFVIGQGRTVDAGYIPTNLLESDGTLAYLLVGNRTMVEFSSTGAAVKTMRIASPGEGYKPSRVEMQSGQMLIQFVRPATTSTSASSVFGLLNLTSGELIGKWDAIAFGSGVMACMTPSSGFVFATSSTLTTYNAR